MALSEREKTFLAGSYSPASIYARILRWRIRKKYWKMKEDITLVEQSGIDLTRRPWMNPNLLVKKDEVPVK